VSARSAPAWPVAAQLVLREIRLEHTLFALPFAYAGALMAARGLPSPQQFVWITLAVLGARTAAMAANRYVDRDLDARNPRTATRALASGALEPAVMLGVAAAGLVLLIVAAFALNPLCAALLPVAGLGIVAYPFCKRFTWGAHFVLGAVDGFAPLGAYVAVAGRIDAAALAIFAAVTLWVAGFDIVYALMDRAVDVAQNIRSIPARFGQASARGAPLALHACMAALLACAGVLTAAGPAYFLGVLLAGALVWSEAWLFARAKDVFVLNERIFVLNMGFSLAFLATTATGFLWRA
jgi:4-hydroxybenzoate polyprenyltransferase